MADLSGNTLASAQDLGSGNQSVTGWVGMTDLSDFYKISLVQRSNVTIALNAPTRHAELQLITDRNNNGAIEAGERLARSSASRLFADQIVTTLEAGTYYIGVSSDALLGSTYGLNIATSSTAAATDPGDTLATARSLSLDRGVLNLQESLSTQDVADFYRFTLNQTHQLQIRLDGLNANADLQLVDSNGVEITKSATSGSAAEFISRSLIAGTYGIRVSGNQASPYSLNIASAAPSSLAPAPAAPLAALAPDTINFDFAAQSILTSENLTITGLATDRNGGSTIRAIDLKLRRPDGTLLDIADATGFTVSGQLARFTTSINISSLKLGAGSYSLLAQAVDTDGLTSGTIERSFTLRADPLAGSWAGQTLKDTQLKSAVHNRFLDGQINRTDMIAILQEVATDDGKVDSLELADLQAIIAAANTLKIDDSVRVLATKVVNGDPANAQFTGGAAQATALGNLDVTKAAQSSQAHLGKLIDKWFLGLDRPTLLNSNHSYRLISGSLFQNGIGINDVKQQSLGDCYFLVTLASAALESPSIIQTMFTDNGDGTFAVRFFRPTATGELVADYVTVDRHLPTQNNRSIYAHWGNDPTSASNELWVALAEKAYAQLNESGWIFQDGTNRYAGIEGGDPENVMAEITNVGTQWENSNAMTKQETIDLFNSNKLVAISIYDDTNGVAVPVTNHAYVGKSYNATTGLFSFHNPWGTDHFEVSWENLVKLAAPINYTRA